MSIPEPDWFTLEEVSLRWSERYGPIMTPDHLVRLHEAGKVSLRRDLEFDGPEGLNHQQQALAVIEGQASYRPIFSMSRKERDDFENGNPIIEAGESLKFAAYVSRDLGKLIEAAKEFWSDNDPEDPTTHSKNEDVETWLISEGFSPSSAKAGAIIIRPNWAHKGRRPKK